MAVPLYDSEISAIRRIGRISQIQNKSPENWNLNDGHRVITSEGERPSPRLVGSLRNVARSGERSAVRLHDADDGVLESANLVSAALCVFVRFLIQLLLRRARGCIWICLRSRMLDGKSDRTLGAACCLIRRCPVQRDSGLGVHPPLGLGLVIRIAGLILDSG